MPDVIPDNQVVLDNQPSGPAPASVIPDNAVIPNKDVIPDNQVKLDSDKSEKYGSGIQSAIAVIEGAAKGVAGPLATFAETKLLGVPEEDIIGREEANPIIHGVSEAAGLGGSLLTGVGEAALIAKAGEAVSGAAKLGKVGSTVLKTAIDSGLFQGGDEISHFILGQSDPDAPVSAALAHIGGAALLGGGLGVAGGAIGNKLGQLAEGKTASKAAKFLSDIGNRFEFLSKNKDIPGAATEEASNLWSAVKSATEHGYELKDQAIQKLVPKEVTSEISEQNQKLASVLSEKHKEMISNPDIFSRSQANEFGNNVNKWMEVATNPESTPHEIFNATQGLKQNFQYNAEYNMAPVSKHDAKFPILKTYRDLAPELRIALEDNKVWGGAADLQQGINKAFSKLKGHQKDFLSSFSTKVLDEKQIDPDKIASVLRQVGRGKGALRGSKLSGFIEPAQKFLQEVEDLHNSIGVESSVPAVSTNVLDEMLSGKTSPGSRAADWLFGGGPRSIGMAGSHIAGTAIGAAVGHPYLGYRAGEHLAPILEEGIGRKLTRAGVSGVLRALASGSHEGVPQAINYAESIGKGANKINNSVNNLFTVGGQKFLNHDFSERDSEKLKKYVEGGNLNQEIQNQVNQPSTAAAPQQNFAHGGEVMAPEPHQPVVKPVKKVLNGADRISEVFPEQSMLLGAAKGRINNYLNTVRPQSNHPKMPFDEEMHDKEKEHSYNRAIKIANKPLSVLDHIKNGTLEPEHVQHMNQLYPELTDHLKKKLTQKITEAQLKNEKPPYKVRQGLALFMGSPLDSNLTPQNIQAAQATFMNKSSAPPNAPVSKNKKNTSKLGEVAGNYKTIDQAAQARQLRSK